MADICQFFTSSGEDAINFRSKKKNYKNSIAQAKVYNWVFERHGGKIACGVPLAIKLAEGSWFEAVTEKAISSIGAIKANIIGHCKI